MIRLLVVDDDPFIRESLKLILETDSEMTVLGTCENGEEAIRFVQDHEPDLVLIDIRMPVCDGVEGTKRIKSAFPNVKVLILTTFDDDEYIIEALRHGAGGYMLKNIPPARIIDGIKAVHHGNMLIHPDIAKKLSGLLQPQLARKTGASLSDYGLTPTEQLIVQNIAEGLSNKEIAQAMFLGEGTVKNYISDILSKLSLRDRTQIAIFYLKL